ncbi:hypothetical protein Vspart_01976 [Vibrio spartinae]|uniref:Uncharacterized protein n=1 Tax=Vibrio spartinae TaxID=1918945 RepID=A0A1N6M9U5_9VIBR|nr:hypothetical protein Vspart_01976 [Vibrio spartinae]SIO96136.1 hypothetical protein VSP9026_03902 [Vibrio spartinae]
MDVQVFYYAPCKPDWLCRPALIVIGIMLVIGLILFIRLVIREYLRIHRTQYVLKRRRLHYKQRHKLKPYHPMRWPRTPRD